MMPPKSVSASIIALASSLAAPLAAADHTVDAWKLCTETALRNYALTTNVPANAVVEAALGACAGKYQAGGATPTTRDPHPAVDVASRETTYKAMVEHWRPELVEGVLKIRKVDQSRQ